MAGLYLYTSNRLERLADILAEIVSQPFSSPFEKEVIVVQSRGMERWIRMQLAQRLGVCANTEFPFPNAVLRILFSSLGKGVELDSSYEPSVLAWRIMDILPQCLSRPEFHEIRDYLGEEAGEIKLYQLSKHIASCFDQYLVFRPDMVLRWEKGQGRHWQAVLWRKLTRGKEPLHKARLKAILDEQMHEPDFSPASLPERLSIFGISSLPPYHLEIFYQVSRFVPVHLFVMNPCKEYWFDIVSERQVDFIVREEGVRYDTPQKLHLETGNPLLASMGQLGRDFLSLILEFDPQEHTLFEDPGTSSMLSMVQSNILNLRPRPSAEGGKITISQRDRSIQIHSCHSRLREIEVLYDNLLALFEEDSGLAPKDIVVMAPDIVQYAPFIEAVFGSRRNDHRAIPYSIADRSYGQGGQLAPAFVQLLELAEGRFAASAVLSFAERAPVKRKFHFSEKDLALIRKWVMDTRIYWGVDATMKAALGLPESKENTWRAGIERLLLGYALPGKEEGLFRGILPYDAIESEESVTLGNFLDLFEILVRTASMLSQPAPLLQWHDRLTQALEDLFCPEELTEHEYRTLRGIIEGLKDEAQASSYRGLIPLSVIKSYLSERLAVAGLRGGFLSEGVTFCSLLPMRSIPFEVIYLLGMNHDAYPRREKELGFDLVASKPRRGDRSRRNDDRYLFLEAIVSARRRFIISYIGQSDTDNSPIPPSPVVSELLDYLEGSIHLPGKELRDHIVVTHRLQPFSPAYFREDSGLFTYFEENLEAARSAVSPNKARPRLFDQDLPQAPQEWKKIPIENIERFLSNPVKFLLKERLKVSLAQEAPLIADQEPATPSHLDDYQVNQRMLKARLSKKDLSRLYPLFRASGMLPHGNVGVVDYERRRSAIETFSESLHTLMQASEPSFLDVDIHLGGCHIFGRIGEFFPSGLAHYRYARVRAKDHLRLWLHHLIGNLHMSGDNTLTSYLCGRDEQWIYPPVEDAQENLEQIIMLYLRGLQSPIPLFPDTSLEYARILAERNGSEEVALRAARKLWEGSPYRRGESEDQYFKVCFGDTNPLDETFTEVSQYIFSPLLACRQRL